MQLTRHVFRNVFVVSVMVITISLLFKVRFDIKGHFDGIFLLKGLHDGTYELKDDLYVGDAERIISYIDFADPRYRISRMFNHFKLGQAHLYYEWDAKDGSGFFRNFFPNGTQLLTCFGRFEDGKTKEPVQGLFVGGGLPASVIGRNDWFMNETGMAYFDGSRWYHIWCNVNEGLYAIKNFKIYDTQWKFLGSKVIDESRFSVVVSSSHQLADGATPLRMDRYVYINAGEPYFFLTIKLTNTGQIPVEFIYTYGDEPWVGNYGSSKGNVGWVKDRLINYEMQIDSSIYSYAGFYHYGNDAIGEGHNFTHTANFIEWFGKDKPDVYFANAGGNLRDTTGKAKIPLSSNERFIGLEWKPKVLYPGQSIVYNLAIGKADYNPKTDLPLIPTIKLPAMFNANGPTNTGWHAMAGVK